MKKYLLSILFFVGSLVSLWGQHQARVTAYFLPQSQDRIRQDLNNFLDSAQSSIAVSMFTFNDLIIAQQLSALAALGIGIEVIIDPETLTYANGRPNDYGRNVVGILQNMNIPIYVGRSFEEGIMHNKYVIVDNQKVWTGSANFTTRALDQQPPSNDENIVIIESPQIAQLFQNSFDQLRNQLPRVQDLNTSADDNSSSGSSQDVSSSYDSESESEDERYEGSSYKRRRFEEPNRWARSQSGGYDYEEEEESQSSRGGWRNDPRTESQKKKLRSLGVTDFRFIRTKGEASDEIKRRQ